ncbi:MULTISPECIES: hypothetical protein [Rheinheimera]|uniref:Peptide zinc metalloprotease protein n=1 Tax=Rheinheimera tangshanensis TaxID=400153 RepID=A0A5C8LRL9_9GAMM|nr:MULTISPECIES: hypothetical protein [Rheinheimera]TXK78279.1 hypothetical protein FU839_16230 [Rheinheimera tangshanensis]GGM62095.1 hypothetical protein GCM10010920_23610 [Rheinheimera tangshanensis]
MNSPDEIYMFVATEVIDNGDHIAIKTSSGRYFQLPKDIFSTIKKYVSSDGVVSKEIPEKYLAKLIDLGVFYKQGVQQGSADEFNHTSSLIPVVKGRPLEFLVNVFSNLLKFKIATLYVIFVTVLFIATVDFQKLMATHSATLHMGYDVLLMIIVYIFFSGVTHELGHSSAFYKYTGKKAEIGVCFNYCFPSFYSDVRDAALLSRKSERVSILIAGVYFQILLFPVLAIPFYLLGGDRNLLLLSYMLLIQAFFNLIPFLRSDGYWLCKELFFTKGSKNTFYLVVIKVFFFFGLSYLLFVCYLAVRDFYNNIYLQGMLPWEQPAFDFFRQFLVSIYLLVGFNKLISWAKS